MHASCVNWATLWSYILWYSRHVTKYHILTSNIMLHCSIVSQIYCFPLFVMIVDQHNFTGFISQGLTTVDRSSEVRVRWCWKIDNYVIHMYKWIATQNELGRKWIYEHVLPSLLASLTIIKMTVQKRWQLIENWLHLFIKQAKLKFSLKFQLA